jgi:hypothetical protein
MGGVMENMLDEARHIIRSNPKLADLVVREVDGELHLFRGDDRFGRLLPEDGKGAWRMEYFRNREGWECLDFTGTLKECLEFLSENEHYLFWG